MTQEQINNIRNFTKYPEFPAFQQYVIDKITEYRNKPLDRNSDIAAQAIAKEDAFLFITDLFSDLSVLSRDKADKRQTYE